MPEVNFSPFQSGIVFAITKLSAEPGLNMRRRQFLDVLGGAAAWPLTARSQRPAIPLVGVLVAGSATSTAREYEAFRSHLRQLGFDEGRNVRFEYRFANGVLDRLPSPAEELVQLNPSIIVSAPVPDRDGVRRGPGRLRLGTEHVPSGRQRDRAHQLLVSLPRDAAMIELAIQACRRTFEAIKGEPKLTTPRS